MTMPTIPSLAADQATSAEDLTYIAEQLPPYNYQEDGQRQGISVDLLEEMWTIMGVGLNRSAIEILPWADGYKRALEENNTVLLTTGRIPEREHLFKWAGPAVSGRYALMARRDRNIAIETPEDLKKYKIGTIVNDMAVQLLLDEGIRVEDLILKTSPTPIIEMLENGTIDAWAYNDVTAFWLIRESGANASEYETAYVLELADAYYAFNNGTSDSLVQAFQQALDRIKGNRDTAGASDYEKTLARYIPTG